MKKNFPPYLSQLVFHNQNDEIEKINGSDYDLFIWLIYQTHKEYSLNGKIELEVRYKDIKESIKPSPNSDSIKLSLKNIGEMKLLSNYLNSYEDKEFIEIDRPFHIEIIVATNGKSYGCKVTTSKEFLKRFDNPIPKVTVDYDIIFSMKKMSKLLYLFLKDALGPHKSKKRKVSITKLRHMMNVHNKKVTNSNFISELKKAIDDINKKDSDKDGSKNTTYKSDIIANYEVLKKRSLKSGTSEIEKIKFIIKKNKNYKPIVNDDIDNTSDEISSETNVSGSVKQTFEEFLNDLVKNEYQCQVAKGGPKDNPTAYKKAIRESLLKDGYLEAKFELDSLFKEMKDEFREENTFSQPHQLIFTDGNDDPENIFLITDDYTLQPIFGEMKINTITKTINFISSKTDEGWVFDVIKCDNMSKWKVSLIYDPPQID